MIKIEPDYRTIDELKEEWECTTSDIFNWASQCLLKIWETESLRMQKAGEPISKQQANDIFHTLTLEGLELVEYLEGDFDPKAYDHEASTGHAITNKEIQRFEKLYKEPESEEEYKARIERQRDEAAANSEAAFNAISDFSTEKTPKAQKTSSKEEKNSATKLKNIRDRPYHSLELLIANQCWNELYSNRKKDSPTPRKGHKKMIEDWLEKHYPKKCKESTSFKERVATIVNPNKKGGAPKIGQ